MSYRPVEVEQPLRVLHVVYEQTRFGWTVTSPEVSRLEDHAWSREELQRRVDARLAEWLGGHVQVVEEVRDSGIQPSIPRDVAELLDIPLDDPDVEQE